VKLSVAIVCKNNEKTLPRVLESVRVGREMLAGRGSGVEVVAYDSGSTDGTIGLLEGAGARVIRGPWLGHIASKQRVLEACAGEWRLHLDSDESLEAACAGSLAAFVCSPGGARGARVNRKVWYLGAWLEHVWQPEWRLRVVRGVDVAAGVARWGGINPHDKMELVGEAAGGEVADLPATAVGIWRGRISAGHRAERVARLRDRIARYRSTTMIPPTRGLP
jgi:glycosyltransferase involved in cell wall biosynthesis